MMMVILLAMATAVARAMFTVIGLPTVIAIHL